MAGTYVQKLGVGEDLSGGSSNIVFNLTTKPTAGNAVVVLCKLYNSSARTWTGSTLTDNCSPANTYTLKGVTAQVPGSNGYAFGAFVCESVANIPAGTMTLTLVRSGFQLTETAVYEFSGTGVYDNDGVSTGSGTSTASASVTPVASATTALAFLGSDSTDTNANINLPSGWTDVEAQQNASGRVCGWRFVYKNVTGTTAQQVTFTHDSNSTATILLLLKDAGGGGGGGTDPTVGRRIYVMP